MFYEARSRYAGPGIRSDSIVPCDIMARGCGSVKFQLLSVPRMEVCTDHRLLSCVGWMSGVGCLVAYAMAAAFGEGAWRYLLGMGGILAAVQVGVAHEHLVVVVQFF